MANFRAAVLEEVFLRIMDTVRLCVSSLNESKERGMLITW